MFDYPCEMCKVEVQQNDATILCQLGKKWNYINYKKLNYKKIKSDPAR